MSEPPVDFLLESVLHLPQPADLDACTKVFKRLVPHEGDRGRDHPTLRALVAEYDFPEGQATVYVIITTLPEQIPPRWRPEPHVPTLSITASCHHIPQVRAEQLARALLGLMIVTAGRMDASGGYVDLGGRQDLPDPPTPWGTWRRVEKRGWLRFGRGARRFTRHRKTAFPDGFVEGKLGFPPKPKRPEPACLLVAGAVLPEDSPAAFAQAKGAGLQVWRAEFVLKPPCLVAGLLVASLDLSQHRADVDPARAGELLADARKRLATIGLQESAGLLMARVMDMEGA